MARIYYKCPKCGVRTAVAAFMRPWPPCDKCVKKEQEAGRRSPQVVPKAAATLTEEVQDALAQAESIMEMIDELPDRAADFGESVGDSVREVMETMERLNTVTTKQQQALDNWESGVGRWIH